MRFLFSFLLLFICVSAYAATMCVPDLSTCDSCSVNVGGGGVKWSATCCGVEIEGVMFYGGYTFNGAGGASFPLVSMPLTPGSTSDVFVFVITYPVVAEYGLVVCSNNSQNGYVNIVPKCAFQQCSVSSYCLSTDPA